MTRHQIKRFFVKFSSIEEGAARSEARLLGENENGPNSVPTCGQMAKLPGASITLARHGPRTIASWWRSHLCARRLFSLPTPLAPGREAKHPRKTFVSSSFLLRSFTLQGSLLYQKEVPRCRTPLQDKCSSPSVPRSRDGAFIRARWVPYLRAYVVGRQRVPYRPGLLVTLFAGLHTSTLISENDTTHTATLRVKPRVALPPPHLPIRRPHATQGNL